MGNLGQKAAAAIIYVRLGHQATHRPIRRTGMGPLLPRDAECIGVNANSRGTPIPLARLLCWILPGWLCSALLLQEPRVRSDRTMGAL